MKTIGMLCDFHGTIVDANRAWIDAFCYFNPDCADIVIDLVYKKTDRRKITEMLGLDYADIVAKYRENLEIRWPVMELIKKISNNKIIIISGSSRERLLLDINKVKNHIDMKILQIYSKEDGDKNNTEFIEKILDAHNFETAYMIGNDIRKDFNPSQRIINIFVPYRDTILKNKVL